MKVSLSKQFKRFLSLTLVACLLLGNISFADAANESETTTTTVEETTYESTEAIIEEGEKRLVKKNLNLLKKLVKVRLLKLVKLLKQLRPTKQLKRLVRVKQQLL